MINPIFPINPRANKRIRPIRPIGPIGPSEKNQGAHHAMPGACFLFWDR